MRISILGGTGDLGKGLALRWVKNHDIIVGSRVKDKAVKVVEEYLNIAKDHYGENISGKMVGEDNFTAVKEGEVIVPCISHEYIIDFAKSIKPLIREDQIIISPITILEKKDKNFYYNPIIYEGKSFSATQLLREILKTNKVIAAFQTISAKKLSDLKLELNYDVLLCGDDKDSIEKVRSLVEEIKNLKTYYVGDLSLSSLVEAQTALLLNLSIRNKIKEPSIKII